MTSRAAGGGTAGAAKFAKRAVTIGCGAQSHALHATTATATATAPPLTGRAGGDHARRYDHVQPTVRTVVNRQTNPLLALPACGHVEIAGPGGREQVDRLGRHGDRTGRRLGIGRDPRLSLGARMGRSDQCNPTQQARGQPGPDQAKVSPEHRAKTFLDGAIAEGPIDPYPLRPESPPKLIEMIQALRGAPATFSV